MINSRIKKIGTDCFPSKIYIVVMSSCFHFIAMFKCTKFTLGRGCCHTQYSHQQTPARQLAYAKIDEDPAITKGYAVSSKKQDMNPGNENKFCFHIFLYISSLSLSPELVRSSLSSESSSSTLITHLKTPARKPAFIIY